MFIRNKKFGMMPGQYKVYLFIILILNFISIFLMWVDTKKQPKIII